MTARTGAATGAPATATASLTTAAVPPAARHPIIRVTFRGGVIIYIREPIRSNVGIEKIVLKATFASSATVQLRPSTSNDQNIPIFEVRNLTKASPPLDMDLEYST